MILLANILSTLAPRESLFLSGALLGYLTAQVFMREFLRFQVLYRWLLLGIWCLRFVLTFRTTLDLLCLLGTSSKRLNRLPYVCPNLTGNVSIVILKLLFRINLLPLLRYMSYALVEDHVFPKTHIDSIALLLCDLPCLSIDREFRHTFIHYLVNSI